MDNPIQMFEFKDIVNTAIGAVLGGVVSWLVTRHYFEKGKPIEQITKSIAKVTQSMFEGLRTAHVYLEFPQFFDSPSAQQLAIPDVQFADRDIPRLDMVALDKSLLRPGMSVSVIFKVVDLGFNFDNPSGAEVFDHHGKPMAVSRVGFGFMTTVFNIRLDDANGKHILTFSLHDQDESGDTLHKSTFKVPFFIAQ